eukprot:scaffold597_cov176-Amphora_coffeaeformis.AAC.6
MCIADNTIAFHVVVTVVPYGYHPMVWWYYSCLSQSEQELLSCLVAMLCSSCHRTQLSGPAVSYYWSVGAILVLSPVAGTVVIWYLVWYSTAWVDPSGLDSVGCTSFVGVSVSKDREKNDLHTVHCDDDEMEGYGTTKRQMREGGGTYLE